MNISFDNSAKTSGKLTIVIEEADYLKDYEKELKNYRKRANVPGFRPGNAPMGMIKRQIGPSLLVDTLNKLVGKTIYDYIGEQKIDMLGEPMPSDEQTPIDIEQPAPYTFMFDIALAPEVNVTLGAEDTIPYYNITVNDEIVDQQVSMYASRNGSYAKVEAYTDGDMLKGDLRQLDAEGNTMEEGITLSDAIISPKYIKNEDEKQKFAEAKMGDIIIFNPRKAYESDTELAAFLKIEKEQAFIYTGDFSYQVTEVSHYEPHAINEELFENTYPGEEIKDEAAFRARVAAEIKQNLQGSTDFQFIKDIRKVAEQKAGEVKYDDTLMKRIMLANNKDKGEEFVEKNYEPSIKELTWSLLRNKLAESFQIKVEENDIREAAKELTRIQFAQYGMPNVPDEYLNNYVEEMLKKQESVNHLVERAIDVKLIAAVKGACKLEEKEITLDEFNKLADAEA